MYYIRSWKWYEIICLIRWSLKHIVISANTTSMLSVKHLTYSHCSVSDKSRYTGKKVNIFFLINNLTVLLIHRIYLQRYNYVLV